MDLYTFPCRGINNLFNITNIIFTMTEQLYTYLQLRFYKENHVKYHSYFEEWVQNITNNQIHYFNTEMSNLI